MPHGLVSSLLQDAVDVVQGWAVLATRKFVLGSLLWAVVGGKCSWKWLAFSVEACPASTCFVKQTMWNSRQWRC